MSDLTVDHVPVTGATIDSLGCSVPTFGQPVTRKVYEWTPHRTEISDDYTSREVTTTDLYMPATAVNLMDRFIVDGDLFETVGVQDWGHGFHGWRPGIVVELRKVDA